MRRVAQAAPCDARKELACKFKNAELFECFCRLGRDRSTDATTEGYGRPSVVDHNINSVCPKQDQLKAFTTLIDFFGYDTYQIM